MANINANDILKSIYYDIGRPGSLGGQKALYLIAKKQIPSLKFIDVKKWLSSQIVYTLHKPVKHKFKRNRILVERPFEQMQADLVDMKEFKNENSGFSYILTAIDIFSKKAYAIALKCKSAKHVEEAMEKILAKHKTFKLMTDQGLEFKNNLFSSLVKKYQILHYFTKNKTIKCSIVERFNKTLKNKMFRLFTLNGNRRFVDEIDKMVESYNNTYHRSIQMTPNQVSLDNHKIVFQNLYGVKSMREYLRKLVNPKLPTGSSVRKKYELSKLDRVYYPNWSDQIYKIYKSVPGDNKPYYFLKNERGDTIHRRFYPDEIQTVSSNISFRVEKILAERTRSGQKEFLVKWLNHSDSDNSWIPAKNITKING